MVTVPTDRALIRHRLMMRFTLRQKAGLAREVFGSYLRQRRRMRHDEKLPAVLADLRRPLTDDGVERTELEDQLTGIRLGRAVSRTLAPVPDARCLLRSLVLVDLLARRGIAASFVLGVRSGPDFEAHAWVEKGGVPLLPPYDGEYERLVDL